VRQNGGSLPSNIKSYSSIVGSVAITTISSTYAV